ncbi:hypothetical protein CMV_011343 [Castanea mollissima]|uniref:Uncharacterized protein n=1 Tax=Castanea mollissima TaxID=60419 RepID=A0A8J4R3H6_9ROSI|nr:hypothetical protein CMV_011343 [Castanea mollissima]
MPNPDFYEVSKMNGLIIYTHGFGIFLPGLFGTVDPYLCKNLNMTARREQLVILQMNVLATYQVIKMVIL